MPYAVRYSPETVEHMEALSARQRANVLDGVDEQLKHQPTVETQNRKPMRANALAPWELRIGDLRVYYDVQESPEPEVLIRAVGVKERNQVRIAGKLVKL
jgi:mRNA-degrading endonuclease RelE of RelBE toxin-antitoxin system